MNDREIKLANSLFDEEMEEAPDIVKIFYSDLDLDARKKIMDAINDADEHIDVYQDDLIREKIEEQLKNIPLFVTRGQEIINKANIDF